MSFDIKMKAGDISIKNGQVEKVEFTEKLVQDILKMALTDVGSNVMVPWYGSMVSKTLIGSTLDHEIVVQIAESQIQNCIENIKKLQQMQISSGQNMSAEEQISAIIDVSVERSATDQRRYDVFISVLTKSLTKVTTKFTVSPF
jgi:phage baseplate assembly protein W